MLENQREIERQLLGCCLMNPHAFGEAVAEGLRPESFFIEANAAIFRRLTEAERAGKPIDFASFAMANDDLRAEIIDVSEAASISRNVKVMVDELHAIGWQFRTVGRLQEVLLAIKARRLYDPLDALQHRLQQVVDASLRDGSSARGPQHISDVMDALFADTEKAIEAHQRGEQLGIPTGFPFLDKNLGGGWLRGTLNIVGARPGVGKTTLAINMLHTIAINGFAGAFFSNEMKNVELARKLLSLSAEVNAKRIRGGDLTDDMLDRISYRTRELHEKAIWFDDSTRAWLERVEFACRRLKHAGKLDLVFVDYLQQYKVNERFKSPRERVEAVSARLKALAGELDIVIVAPAQLNREAVKAAAKPDIHHLKEAGGIEQDADLIVLIHDHDDGRTDLFIGKNRNGKARIAFPVERIMDINAIRALNVNIPEDDY